VDTQVPEGGIKAATPTLAVIKKNETA